MDTVNRAHNKIRNNRKEKLKQNKNKIKTRNKNKNKIKIKKNYYQKVLFPILFEPSLYSWIVIFCVAPLKMLPQTQYFPVSIPPIIPPYPNRSHCLTQII